METQPPRLAGQFAALRATTATTPKGAWIPAPVHALIMACLARIFGRLEQLMLLWHACCLPAPPSPRTPKCRNPSSVPHSRAPARQAHRPASALGQLKAADRSSHAKPAMHAPTPRPAASRPIASSSRPHAARDPPNQPQNPARRVAQTRPYHYVLTTS